ncbi:phosphonate metabolism protein/1,5-bisphosphokinase (PRPP-forming) PhnN [Devosia rhodophyticola]|uniref:Ribose 1,5-bisphosphate phosphokinase PhnN n=1 Tax=Devosia rhodophyticola TaxID=3026423 RepID=A0ABY7Z3B5_9HYPH|nr:phosphonate metabolism protein/1,5-bisphosphokinase (PRPP-forming) PhnN [Devosia rhodophyticola]WDR07485.1 phosphonate metabolism protein/1,5-bisphosphokinase (PRPP-forming) PhnN [Devosia rhodophyticola]
MLIVGASGAGKDTLINGARDALVADRRFSFARRLVTRPADQTLEDHETLDEAGFRELEEAGRLAFSWQAHGLRYGLPLSVNTDLALGKVVIANGSRQTLPQAITTFPRCVVMLITAEISLRAKRLAGRGREDHAQIAARLARETRPLPDDVVPIVIDNSGTPTFGITRLVLALRQVADHHSA